ncbi:MAG: hypothetical protein U1E97_11750 [Alphaproteobacteria bacterium]
MIGDRTDPGTKGDGAAEPVAGARRRVLGADLQLALAAILRLADIAVITLVGVLTYWLRNDSLDFPIVTLPRLASVPCLP